MYIFLYPCFTSSLSFSSLLVASQTYSKFMGVFLSLFLNCTVSGTHTYGILRIGGFKILQIQGSMLVVNSCFRDSPGHPKISQLFLFGFFQTNSRTWLFSQFMRVASEVNGYWRRGERKNLNQFNLLFRP